MSNELTAVPVAMEAMSATAVAAGETVTAAGSFDGAATFASACAAIGPIGVTYLAALAQALGNNQASTLALGALHAGIGAGTEASKTAFVAVDSAL
ncbi:hypothetical protein [Mycobacteroides sp. LB1]|uniref:hypothetical protein n=1 Tax=Mycobacteroides sp. LB1 TaxID=2750814 RepID=UPI0015E00F39|nr:hypothetical protein [Mycobacteroides sp. LB1]